MAQHDPRVDRSRGAVYQAEDAVATVMRRPGRAVRVSGVVLRLPAEVHFGELAAVQAYVDHVVTEAARSSHPARNEPVRVSPRRGFRTATYCEGVISVPAADPRGRWALTRSVILHEVAHHLAGATGHGPQFRATLIELYRRHVSDSAAELLHHMFAPIDAVPEPGGLAAVDDQVRRVAALLAKAEATVHADEAEAYLAKAALVAQRHSVDLAVAALETDGRAEHPTHRMLTIGEPRRRLNKMLTSLLVRVAAAWAVPVDIGHGSTYALVYGMPRDLDQVESVFAAASSVMLTRAHEHVQGGSWRGGTYRRTPGAAARPVTAAVARNAFLLGFIERIGQNLAQAQRTARADQAGSYSPGVPAATRRVELALRAHELAVTDYHRATSPARGSWRGTASAAAAAAPSRRAGQRAADAYGRKGLGPSRAAIGA